MPCARPHGESARQPKGAGHRGAVVIDRNDTPGLAGAAVFAVPFVLLLDLIKDVF